MPKQTKLDEQAMIYQPRREQTEKEKLKDMVLQDKLSYLWEYYKIHALITVAALALIIYFIYETITPNINPVFSAAIIDSAVFKNTMEKYKADFSDYLQLDPKRECVNLNDTYYFSNGAEFGTSPQQVLNVHIAAGEIDVIIAPESEFKSFAYSRFFTKLSDALPTDVYSSLTDYFYLSDTEEDTEKSAYGIYLTDTELFHGVKYNSEPYVLGILHNYPHVDNTTEFIRYLFKGLNK